MRVKTDFSIAMQIKTFLKRHWDRESPLLLGCSGGTDSKALLYALFEADVTALHVAHVDHGWREESAQEALELKREVEELGYRFHSARLVPSTKNREAQAREGRMAFFHSLFRQLPFQALLLAHQAEDLAETSLKRILEGAHFSFSGGMQPISKQGDLPIWRPLLFTRKSEILTFLEKKKLTPFLDPTNSDPAYLRTRMRGEIFPFLNRSFGKETTENLILFSKRSYELKEYLDRKITPIPSLSGPWGTILFLSNVERIEARHLLQKHLLLSRPLLETLLDWIETEKPNQQLTPQILADRAAVFLLSKKEPHFEDIETLSLGSHRCGDWIVEVSETKETPVALDWREVWSGRFSVILPIGNYA